MFYRLGVATPVYRKIESKKINPEAENLCVGPSAGCISVSHVQQNKVDIPGLLP